MEELNTHELKSLVADGESERLELKRSTGQRTEAMRTVCAMLNGLGGHVMFGVTDRHEIVGQQVTAKALDDTADELRRIEPLAFPDIETITVKKDHDVIVLWVPGSGGLYHYDGRPYIRRVSTTTVMPREEYERRLIERLHVARRWENERVAEGISIKDLDKQEIGAQESNRTLTRYSVAGLYVTYHGRISDRSFGRRSLSDSASVHVATFS